MLAFALAGALWLAPSLAQGFLGRDHPFATALGKHFPEAGVALLAASLLFVAPISWRKRRFALTWPDGHASTGACCCCSAAGCRSARSASDRRRALGGRGHRRLAGSRSSPASFMLLAVVIAADRERVRLEHGLGHAARADRGRRRAPGGLRPGAARARRGLAATCGFIFPVSTPPNAIVFGTGRVPLTRMIRAGALLDVACVLVRLARDAAAASALPRAG